MARENRAMKTPSPSPVYLHRVDSARNMARFYLLSVQPTLFGQVSLVRNWGRIGSCGQAKIETFDTPDDVQNAFARLERSKRNRGYVDPGKPATSNPT